MRTGHKGTRCLKFAVNAFHVVLKVIWTFAVLRLFIVSAATGEVCGGMVFGPWQRAITDAIAVYIFVTGKSAKPIEVFFVQNFPARDWLFWIFKRISHPVIH